MKNTLLLLLLTFILASCGAVNKKHIQHLEGSKQFATSNSVFSPYVDSFTKNARTYLSRPSFVVGDIPVNFGDTTKDEFDGVCNSYSDGTKEVLIKKSWWDRASVHQREVMIYHELGHCSLNRDHDTELITKDSYQVKASIMNPTIPGSSHYLQYKTSYLTELFTYDKEPLKASVGI